MRLAVLVSGSGTVLEAILGAGLSVNLVVADRPCRGLEVATTARVDHVLVDRRGFGGFQPDFDRSGYTVALTATLREWNVDLVAMAGFGTIMTSTFTDAFAGRILNTHPSLLPDFKGWHAVAQALEAGVAETGCTVHLATAELDDGPILAQRRIPIEPGESEADLHERIKRVERELYPAVISRVMGALAEGREPVSVAEAREEDR